MWKSTLAILSVVALAACSSGSSKPSATIPKVGSVLPQTGNTTVKQTIDPCTLMTVVEASQLAGATVKRTKGGGPGSLYCIYAGASAGAEVTVRVDKDVATAHAQFPDWVQPIKGSAPDLTVTKVANFFDEASTTRNKNVNNGIYVRRGAALVKIGAYPPANDEAMRKAATTALSRIR